METEAKVFKGGFWMGMFNGPTPKRHMIWTNDEKVVRTVDARAGYLPASLKAELSGEPLVTKHVDKNGVMRQTGVKRKLKASQILGLIFQLFF